MNRKHPDCIVEDCTRSGAAGRGLCKRHHRIFRERGTLPPKRTPSQPSRRADGERCIQQSGYVTVKRDGEWLGEHRMVLEGLLGRGLREGENVHHRNGIRSDNRLENLELWVVPQPAGQRVSDLIDFVVGHYRDEVVELLSRLE